MARVPTAESLGVGSGPGKIVPLQGRLQVQASPADFGALQAQQIGAFGQDLGQVGATLFRAQAAVEERDTRAQANKFGLEARKHWLEDNAQRELGAAPGAPGHRQQLLADYQAYREDALKDLPPGLYRSLVEDDLGRLELTLDEKAIGFEAQAKRAKAETDYKAALGTAGSILITDPGQFSELLTRQLKDIEGSAMPAAWKEETARATTAALTKDMMLGLIQQEPHGAAELLRTTPMPGLEGTDQVELLDRAQRRAEALDNERDRQRREGMAEAQQTLRDRVDDAAALLADGKDAGVLPTLADIEAAFPATQVPRVWAGVQDKIRLGRAIGSVAGKPLAEQDAILAGMTPDPAAPNYADQVAARDATARAIDQERSALRQDPAAYVRRHNPAVERAFAEAGQDPAKNARAVRMSLAEQERIGVPPNQVAPLPKEHAGSIVERFKTAATSDERLGLLAPITLGLQDDTVGRKILDQLEDAGLPPAAAIALERFREGDIGAAREILGLITADPKDAPKLGDATAKDVQAAVDAKFAGPGWFYEATAAGLAAKAASLVADPGMQRALELQRSTMLRLAQSYAAQGVEPAAAAERANKVLYGGKQVLVDDDLGAVTVPQGVDRRVLETNLRAARQTLDLSVRAPQRESYPNDAAWLLAVRDHEQRVQDLREDGQWLDGPNGGFVLVDPLLGTPVPGADGRPRVWSLEEIAGTGRPAPDLSALRPTSLSLIGRAGDPWAARPVAAATQAERPALLAALQNNETGGHPTPETAINTESGATGVYQITADAVRDVAADLGRPEVAGMSKERIEAYLLEHPDFAAQAGEAYFDQKLQETGSVPLAYAAYFAGKGNLDRLIAAHGDPRTGEVGLDAWLQRVEAGGDPKTAAYVRKAMAFLGKGGNDRLQGGGGEDRLGAGEYAPPGYTATRTASGVEYERNPDDPYWQDHEPPIDLWGRNANLSDYLRNVFGVPKGTAAGLAADLGPISGRLMSVLDILQSSGRGDLAGVVINALSFATGRRGVQARALDTGVDVEENVVAAARSRP